MNEWSNVFVYSGSMVYRFNNMYKLNKYLIKYFTLNDTLSRQKLTLHILRSQARNMVCHIFRSSYESD